MAKATHKGKHLTGGLLKSFRGLVHITMVGSMIARTVTKSYVPICSKGSSTEPCVLTPVTHSLQQVHTFLSFSNSATPL